jgi:fructokinase
MTERLLYGGIEAGGTKFVCAVGSDPENIVDEIRFPTTTPAETIQRVCDFFVPYLGQLHGIGLGSFGPVDIDPDSPTYGYITTTPKPHWANTNILGLLRGQLNLPIAMDMDVAAAAMGEFKWGACKGLDPALYLTIGTGIGGGFIVNGKPFRGIVSLEMGHIRIPRDPGLDPFNGPALPRDCFEGLASGPAIQARLGACRDLSNDDPFWQWSGFIAYALTNYICTFCAKKIIPAGSCKKFLFRKVRKRFWNS